MRGVGKNEGEGGRGHVRSELIYDGLGGALREAAEEVADEAHAGEAGEDAVDVDGGARDVRGEPVAARDAPEQVGAGVDAEPGAAAAGEEGAAGAGLEDERARDHPKEVGEEHLEGAVHAHGEGRAETGQEAEDELDQLAHVAGGEVGKAQEEEGLRKLAALRRRRRADVGRLARG